MSITDWLIIVLVVVGVVIGVLFFLNRWASKKQVAQQDMIDKTKQRADIYVIDKRRDKAENVTLPKVVTQQMPRISKFVKMYFVKAKIGPQITTLMCDKNVYNHVDVKKTYKAELAGMYIVSVKGMKSPHEVKQAAKNRKIKEKEERKSAK